MNKQRRARLEQIAARIRDEIIVELEQLRDDEQEYLDNVPQSLQDGERATASSEAIQEIEDALQNLEQVVDQLNTARGEG